MRFIESENERCIGCGLCEKICISNCIRMETSLDENARKRWEIIVLIWGVVFIVVFVLKFVLNLL